MNFERGDVVYYLPTMDGLPPLRERPQDVGIVNSITGNYVNVTLCSGTYIDSILPFGLRHHPLSPKAARERMARVLPDIAAAVNGRVAALTFSAITGITAVRGLGPADVIRAFLEPPRIPTSRKRRGSYIRSLWPSDPRDAPTESPLL
jgi:hypothetical protein